MNVLLVLGHPRVDSFCGALADQFARGARQAGVNLRRIDLARLTFERDVTAESPADQPLEPDLIAAQRQLRWADHLVVVYPNWWGTMPALLKAFFDRVLIPGFAFSFYEEGEGAGHERLLSDMTAELVVTMDMPRWVYRLIYRRPGFNAIRKNTLGFVGIRTTRTTSFGPVRESTHQQRQEWLEEAEQRGRSLASGPEPPLARHKRRLVTAVRAMRLEFYPMAWVAFAVGALAAGGDTAGAGGVFSTAAFWFGLSFLFTLETTTVLINEYVDLETDRRNTFAGPFTGGSRVLVEGAASLQSWRRGIGLAFGLSILSAVGVLLVGHRPPIEMALVMGVLAILALGYTLAPLKLSYRTLGELDVATTHSIGVLLVGYVVLGGNVTDPTPWILGTPLLLATIPSITLAGVPDMRADRAVGKRTIAVRFGVDGAAAVATGATVLAVASVLAAATVGPVVDAYPWPILVVVPHAIAIIWAVMTRLDPVAMPDRIDGLLALALGYVLPFGVIPLLALL